MSSYGLWLSAAGMKVSEHRQTLLANNMANMETTGFKEDLAVVTRRQLESRTPQGGLGLEHPVWDGLPGGMNVNPPHVNHSPGTTEATGNPLDVAIHGKGFFAVRDGSNTRYTRDGRFTMNRSGELVLSAGNGEWKVLDESDAPIVLNVAGGAAEFLANGSVKQDGQEVGKLAVRKTNDEQKLRKVGANLFEATTGQMVPSETVVSSGMVERSNFDTMNGLVAMIEASRAYELNATMLKLQDDAVGQAVSRIARVA
ncbi:MAG: flagellar hook basal-body protein [Planctomycetota bacterium]